MNIIRQCGITDGNTRLYVDHFAVWAQLFMG
jgi:hypothetical protein